MPEIPVGDVVRSFKLPGWLRWIMDLLKGVKIRKGDTTIVLSEEPGATAPRKGLDQPHRIEPPQMGGPRR